MLPIGLDMGAMMLTTWVVVLLLSGYSSLAALVAALLAPRRLTVIGTQLPPALVPTRSIFELTGAGDAIRTADSIATAVDVSRFDPPVYPQP